MTRLAPILAMALFAILFIAESRNTKKAQAQTMESQALVERSLAACKDWESVYTTAAEQRDRAMAGWNECLATRGSTE